MSCNQYSGNQVAKAGNEFLNLEGLLNDEKKFDHVMNVLSFWRFCHEVPLERAWELLQTIAKKYDSSAILAKRLKRYLSIHKKLVRFEKMSLKNMQDIGGCRAIFTTEKRLMKAARDLRRRKEFKTSRGKSRSKNYIKNPKPDGYRSYHLIGLFPDKNGSFRKIEIQLRTRLQHYWATALEIVDLFTGQALKSNQGDEDWEEFFAEVSRQFSIMDKVHMFATISPRDPLQHYKLQHYKQQVVRSGLDKKRVKVQQLAKKLKVQKKFSAFAESIRILDERFTDSPGSSYVLLQIDTQERNLKSKVFTPDNSRLAEAAYIKAEKESAQNDDIAVALVSSGSVGGIQEAYPNFFADSTKFLEHLHYILS